MEKKRKTKYLILFSLYTSINIFLLYKINGSKEVRDSWRTVYVRNFHWWDLLVYTALFVFSYLLSKWFIHKAVPILRTICQRYCCECSNVTKGFAFKIFGIIFLIWIIFFLVFYPGTANNDAIFILQNPIKLSNHHPIVYNLYTYAFYYIGCLLHNPNFGLALLSLVQMAGMAYVLTRAITILHRKGASLWLCCGLAMYFGISPVFPTYAVSALKDTPFSICLFALLLDLYELADAKGELLSVGSFRIHMALCMFGVVSFRNNGILVIAGLAVVLFIIYKNYMKQILAISFGVIAIWLVISSITVFIGNEQLFQEKVGIPIQQVAAAVVKGKPLNDSEKEYLYRLLPEDKWQLYAPGCSDMLKWNDEFDRQYLNQTKQQFMQIWGQLLIKNPKAYTEAYILGTYGIWGIETRNKEQYYNKEIYQNTLGLYQQSPLPAPIRDAVYIYYCNRFTYRYLSMGTAFWLFLAVTLWMLYNRLYRYVVVTVPVWLLFISLLLATPIAFTFRYGFVIAMLFPFYVLLPFMTGSEGSCLHG